MKQLEVKPYTECWAHSECWGLLALWSWTLSWTHYKNVVKTVSLGLNHPISQVNNSLSVTKHITRQGINILLFILLTTTTALFTRTEEDSVWTDTQLGPTSRTSFTTDRGCLSSQTLPLPPPSPALLISTEKSAVETHSGHICQNALVQAFCPQILMKQSITKRSFLFTIYVLKVLLNIQRGPRCIRDKRNREVGREDRCISNRHPTKCLPKQN